MSQQELALEIDFDQTPDGGGSIPPGRYYMRCVYADAATHPYPGGVDHGYELRWECLAGPQAGRQIFDWRYASWNGDVRAPIATKLKLCVRALLLLAPVGQKTTLTPSMFLGKDAWVTIEPGKPYLDKATGQQKDGRNQVGFDGYEAGAAPPDVNPNVGKLLRKGDDGKPVPF